VPRRKKVAPLPPRRTSRPKRRVIRRSRAHTTATRAGSRSRPEFAGRRSSFKPEESRGSRAAPGANDRAQSDWRVPGRHEPDALVRELLAANSRAWLVRSGGRQGSAATEEARRAARGSAQGPRSAGSYLDRSLYDRCIRAACPAR
jgi:hypothetical protein